MTIDLKDFYYNTPMEEFEYMQLPLAIIPQEIIDQYKLQDIQRNGIVYMEIRKGMPGLKQAGKLANDRLQAHLLKYGYSPVPRTASLWKHDKTNVMFTLVVDDFGVRFTKKEDAQHLIDSLQALYPITVDWTGTKYLGLTLKWDYISRRVDISMPGYIKAVLLKFLHILAKQRDAPHAWIPPSYGAKIQYTDDDDDSPALDPKQKTEIQQIFGCLLYYALAIDATMLVALSDIASEQSKATSKTRKAVDWLLDYAATHPNATIRYEASDMALWSHSDASYLPVKQARSRAGAIFFLGQKWYNPTQPPIIRSKLNGLVHVVCTIIRHVVCSAAEAEIAAAFLTAQAAVPMRITLEEMGHPLSLIHI